METPNQQYPRYYRKDGKCIKVISPTEGRIIELAPQVRIPLRSIITEKDRLDKELEGMTACDSETFKNFLFTFYKQVKEEHASLNL